GEGGGVDDEVAARPADAVHPHEPDRPRVRDRRHDTGAVAALLELGEEVGADEGDGVGEDDDFEVAHPRPASIARVRRRSRASAIIAGIVSVITATRARFGPFSDSTRCPGPAGVAMA